MTSRPSSAALLLCSLSLTACEVPPPEQAEVAPSDTPTDTVDDAAELEPLPADSAIIRLDAIDPDLEVWRDRDISEDPPREPGPIQIGSVLTFFGLSIARTAEDLVAGEVEVAFLGTPVDMGVGFRGAGRSSSPTWRDSRMCTARRTSASSISTRTTMRGTPGGSDRDDLTASTCQFASENTTARPDLDDQIASFDGSPERSG
ncbi:hypothetical protein [Candidatus Palauibacter sp.]|uniref:hypothetical protein n=1 Tax=Candidatus Palauibacter sp. TaxID=3101350 RepID=UPI003C6F4D2E